MILATALVSAAFALFVWGMMALAARWMSRWVSLIIGGAVIVYLSQNMVRGMMYCAVDPTYVPPDKFDTGSDGTMIFNCDSAGGLLDYSYLYLVAPITIAALCFLVWRYRPSLNKS